jgi:alpha-galactosidase
MMLHKFVVLASMIVAILIPSSLWAVSPTADEMSVAKTWVEKLDKLPQTTDASPFFSFTYDGKPSAELLPTWKMTKAEKKIDENRVERTLTWTDPKTGLEVRCVAVLYADFPVLEWTVYFKNTGKADTPILEGIQGLDVAFHREGEGDYVLRSTRGDHTTAVSYEPTEEKIGKGDSRRFVPVGGRPTGGAYPYYNVEWSGQGAIVVLGWPGQWAAQFDCDDSNALKVRGGQELLKTKLLPGEEIRSPLSVLMFWKGEAVRSQNLWRRWMVAHNMPRPGGKLPRPFIFGMGPSAIALHPAAAPEIDAIDAYLKAGIKFDYWWMDAGWYPSKRDWWTDAGTWEVDKERFPKGIREVSDHAHSKDMKFVLWFEPERAGPNTWLSDNHPEWIIGGKGGGLVNIGNPDAWKWIVERVDSLIDSERVDIYRQDYNVDPLSYWRAADTPDRQGITENKYVCGYLAYWDELRRRHPNLLIDSCASGGRRNDLETLRRSVPLLRSDYYSAVGGRTPESMTGSQGHTYGLASWVPFFGTGVYGENAYEFRSHITPALGISVSKFDELGKIAPVFSDLVKDWKSVSGEFSGDYYPLTKYSLSEDEWMAWQFNRPETGTGIVQAFRHKSCPQDTIRVKLQGLEPNTIYAVTDLDRSSTKDISSKELSENGLEIILDKPQSSALIAYKKKS